MSKLTKWFKTIIFMMVGVMAIELTPVRAKADEPKGVGIDGVPVQNWMSYLPDDVPVSRINMLGSHDSGCYNIASPIDFWFETQSENISEQLESGARVFDVRTGPYEMSDPSDPYDLIIHHSKRYCYYNKKNNDSTSNDPYLRFGDYFEEVAKFLDEHPSETVILLVTDHSDDKEHHARKLLDGMKEDFNKKREHFGNWYRFDYYEPGDDVPKLGDVRGKCILLLDDNVRTAFEDDYMSCSSTKIKNFRKVLNLRKNEPPTKLSLAKDKFCEQDIHNKEGKEQGDIQVEQNNLNINLGLLETPQQGSISINHAIASDEWYSERRYGWIMMDYIGDTDDANNLTRKIINTNQGGINYYVSTNVLPDYYTFQYDMYLEGVADDGQTLIISNQDLHDKYNLQTLDSGNEWKISAAGLPLYAPDKSYYKYSLKVGNEGYKISVDSQDINNEYKVLDGKWSARQQYDTAHMDKSDSTMSMEIKWNYNIKEYKEPTNREELYKNINAIVLNQKTDSGMFNEIKLTDIWDLGDRPYIDELEQLSDEEGTYYKTKVLLLPEYNQKTGETYNYEIDRIEFKREYQGGIVYKWDIEQREDGVQRIVVDVRTGLDQVDVIGKTYWNDGNDQFGTQEKAFNSTFGCGKEIKYNMTSCSFGSQEFYSLVKDVTKEDDARCFTVAARRYDIKGDEYTDRIYTFPENTGDNHYILTENNDNEAWYELLAPTDLTVIWNLKEGETIPSEYANGITIGLTNGESLTAIPSGDGMIWMSDAKDLTLFDHDSNSYKYKLNDSSLDAIRLAYDDYLISTDTVASVNDEGYPEMHFTVNIDSVADTVISGTIEWDDNQESSEELSSKDCVRITRSINGDIEESVPEEDLSEIEWERDHFTGKLPSITMDGRMIEYFVEFLDVPGYTKEQIGENTYRYTKVTTSSGEEDITEDITEDINEENVEEAIEIIDISEEY